MMTNFLFYATIIIVKINKNKKMFKDIENPKNEEMFKFAITITLFLFVIVTLAFSEGISCLINIIST
ncbi:MAG TPA: hypothetical protein DIC35_05135 [Candidatus Moranbacteria bacterium]|nr:hypothetical protein [Candidatus Moranbacteria bacterium]